MPIRVHKNKKPGVRYLSGAAEVRAHNAYIQKHGRALPHRYIMVGQLGDS